jgi:replication factor C subunit 3/5
MVLICKSVHKLIAPIRSRCINIRIPAPSQEDIKGILMRIAKDQVLDISHENLQKIVKISGRNLRDAISQLECYKYSKKSDTDILHPFKPEIK